jgi:FkbM family methyltransferase
MYAEVISRAIRDLSLDVALGALDSAGYEERASEVAQEAAFLLESGSPTFAVNYADQVMTIPLFRFGSSVTTVNLFDYKELSIFALYQRFLNKFTKFLDLGSNIGVHSMAATILGATVRSWEPDITVSGIQRQIFQQHGLSCTLVAAAAGVKSGRADFIHLNDNQTGSHIAGKKPEPYGSLTTHEVEVRDVRGDIEWADLVKMDVEGSETEILTQTPYEILAKTSIVLELTSLEAARELFRYLDSAPVSLYCQKHGWQKPKSIQEMPSHHSHGSLVIIGHEYGRMRGMHNFGKASTDKDLRGYRNQ